MLFMALLVAGCAGYFSVWGLSQLFAGASTAVIIMATGLEIGKVVTTTALHRYWGKISNWLRFYLTTSVVILMLITSAGIYGFLSNAYQKTANKLEIHEGEISILNGKKEIFEKKITDNKSIIEQKNTRNEQLALLRGVQENRIDAATSNRNRSGARSDIETSNNEIRVLTEDIDKLNQDNSRLNDSINKYNTMVLELKSGSDVAAEVGPLKYISELTGVPMAQVVNYLILLLIFVFDPLAVALILMTNRVFEIENDTNTKEKTVEALNEAKISPETTSNDSEEEVYEEPIMIDEQYEDIEEPKAEEVIVEEPKVEEIIIEEPKAEEPKIRLEDIKEIKTRGYSVDVPQPKSNTVERIGSNKFVKNNNNDTVYFRRNK